MGKLSLAASMSESNSSSQQSANNQNFSKMFGDKNLGKPNYTVPAAIIAGVIVLYFVFKSKKVV